MKWYWNMELYLKFHHRNSMVHLWKVSKNIMMASFVQHQTAILLVGRFLLWTNIGLVVINPLALQSKITAITGVVQCFFTSTEQKYFAVDELMINADLDSLYATFIHDYLPSVALLLMLPPNTSCDVPPLLAHTGRHLHLGSFVTDEGKCKKLVASAL